MFTTRLRLHGFRLVGLAALIVAVLAAGAPGAAPAQAAGNGDDYASNELGNPWDMSDASDIAFEHTRGTGNVTNLTFSNGVLSATAKTGDPRITFRWPMDPHVNSVPQDGNYRPIDASKYKYFTVRVNVPGTQYAQVLWLTGFGGSTGSTGFKTLQSGWNTVTFDLTSGASGAAWSGSIQGLMFDPMNATGTFQIDYVRLSTTPPTDPDNIPPQLRITAPSFISGPDYASTVGGNPWDMSDAGDARPGNITGASFSNGNFSGTNANGDSYLMLNVPTPIDTGRFKYLTYRMQLDGQQDLSATGGSVARIFWWTTRPEEASVSNDIVVYEGYQTVSFDLTKIKLEANSTPWTSSRPIVLRLDPHEFPTPRTFHVDYVMLTGDNYANTSYTIRYQASDGNGSAPDVQFFYDKASSGFNGTPIRCGAAATGAPAPRAGSKVLLPLVTGGAAPAPVQPEGASCAWNTAGVSAGTYYIYGVASDGVDTVRRYSETPVIVSH